MVEVAQLRKNVTRLAAAAVLAGGSVAVLGSPAQAVTSHCSAGLGQNTVGTFHPWYAWAICTGGSGHYYANAACWMGPGWYIFPSGPVKSVGQGQSRVACPDNDKPTSYWITTY
jgi:hypothetical protein